MNGIDPTCEERMLHTERRLFVIVDTILLLESVSCFFFYRSSETLNDFHLKLEQHISSHARKDFIREKKDDRNNNDTAHGTDRILIAFNCAPFRLK